MGLSAQRWKEPLSSLSQTAILSMSRMSSCGDSAPQDDTGHLLDQQKARYEEKKKNTVLHKRKSSGKTFPCYDVSTPRCGRRG